MGMKLFEDVDYAWAAGVIDGEGCVYIARKLPTKKNGCRTPCYTVAVKVAMGHEPTVLRLRRIFGSGSKHRSEQVGWNDAYIWIVQAKLCQSALLRIKPCCITKAKEIDVALEFLAMPRWYGGNKRGPKSAQYQAREYRLWDRMRRLKPRTRFRLEHGKTGGRYRKE